MTKVVIFQEYVPEYRVAFFDRLVELAANRGIEILVAAGQPNKAQAQRGDDARPQYVLPISQRELRLGERRVVFRNALSAAAGADLLVLEQARRNLDAYLLFLPRVFRKSPWALWGHGRDYVESRSRFSTWLQMAITARADWFFAYTPGGADHLRQRRFPAEQITTVMNAVDTVGIRKGLSNVSRREISEFRESHGIAQTVVSFIGALDESKRIPFLIEAIRRLGPEFLNVSFVIAGDGPVRQEIVDLTADLPNVHTIGRADAKKKCLLLSISRFLVVPGRVGLIAVDSLAAGVPIVTTNWRHHAPEFEYLVDGINSRISEDTLDDYVQAIREMLTNDKLYRRLSLNCLSGGNNLGIEQMAQNFLGGIVHALGNWSKQ